MPKRPTPEPWPASAKAQVAAAALGNPVLAGAGVLGAVALVKRARGESFRPFRALREGLERVAAAGRDSTVIEGGAFSPSFEARPTFQAPTFEAPSFAAPVFEAPRFEAPRFEAPSFLNAPSFAAPSFAAPTFINENRPSFSQLIERAREEREEREETTTTTPDLSADRIARPGGFAPPADAGTTRTRDAEQRDATTERLRRLFEFEPGYEFVPAFTPTPAGVVGTGVIAGMQPDIPSADDLGLAAGRAGADLQRLAGEVGARVAVGAGRAALTYADESPLFFRGPSIKDLRTAAAQTIYRLTPGRLLR